MAHGNGNSNGSGNGSGQVALAGGRGARYPSFESPTVDKVMVEERAAALGKRSIKKETKVAGLKLAISMMDLTTLEGKDSAGKVRQMSHKARSPARIRASLPAPRSASTPSSCPSRRRPSKGRP